MSDPGESNKQVSRRQQNVSALEIPREPRALLARDKPVKFKFYWIGTDAPAFAYSFLRKPPCHSPELILRF